MRSDPNRPAGRLRCGVEITCGEMLAIALTGRVPRNVKARALAAASTAKTVKGAFADDGNDPRPWQYHVADYCVREGGDGKWGIYLREYNCRLATFSANSAALRDALTMMFNTAHAIVASEQTALDKLPKLREKSKMVTVRGRKHWRAAREFAG